MTRPPEDRAFFLRKSSDIERAKRTGRRVQTPLFNLVFCRSDVPHARVGIVVGKRLGGAVMRNRAKRIFRELARQVRQQLVPRYDMLIFPRRDSLAATHMALREMWRATLQQQGLLRSSGT